MTTPSLGDLRYLYYGGGSAAEYQFLQDAYNAGISAQDVLAVGQKELGYAESAVEFTVPVHASVYTLVPGMALTVPVGTKPITIEIGDATPSHATAAGFIRSEIFDITGNAQKQVFLWQAPIANAISSFCFRKRISGLPAGDRTFQWRARTDAGVAKLSIANLGVTYMRIFEG